MVFCALSAVGGCEPVSFDFSEDEDTEPTDTETGGDACEDLQVEQVLCETDAGVVVGCTGSVEVATVQIDLSAGCTPSGQALGIASFATEGADAGPIDVFAWVEAAGEEAGPFADDAYLAVFEDDCGDDPFGEGTEPDCDYEPWLVAPMVFADAPIFLHVQTLTPSGQGTPIELDYQVRTSGTWTYPLPADEPLLCLETIDSPPAGPHLGGELLDHPPWDGEWQELDLTGAPPALQGEPRICPAASLGWRQAAYQLRNQGDDPLQVTRIQIGRRISPLELEPIPFHFEILACVGPTSDPGEIEPAQAPLASSCHDGSEHASKTFDLQIEPWIPWEPSTQYVLIVQAPPTAGGEVEIRLQVEALSKTVEGPRGGM